MFAATADSRVITTSPGSPCRSRKSTGKPAFSTSKVFAPSFGSRRTPKYVSNGYVESVVRRLSKSFPSIALELGPLEASGYAPLVNAGCEALIVYQETYDENTYRSLHTAGPKKHFNWRMDTAEQQLPSGIQTSGNRSPLRPPRLAPRGYRSGASHAHISREIAGKLKSHSAFLE